MISPEAVQWAKPFISRILGIPVQDAEVESILAMDSDEAICRHLAAFSESPTAYIEATDFIKSYRNTFTYGEKVKSLLALSPKKPKVVFKNSKPQVTYKNEEDMDNLFQESLLEGLTIQAPRSVMMGSGKSAVQRIVCGCFGLDHDVSRNCISCGRIMCVLEAVDTACVNCGFGANQKVDKKIFQEYKEGPGYTEAVAMMQKLIGFDKDGAARTRVYDTHTDFYEEEHNPWCTEGERQLSAVYARQQDAVYEDPTKLLATHACLQIDLDNMKLSMSDAQQNFVEEQNKALEKYLESEQSNLKEANAEAEKSARSKNLVGCGQDEDGWVLDQNQRITPGDAKLLDENNNWEPVIKNRIQIEDIVEVGDGGLGDEVLEARAKPDVDEEFTRTDIKLSQDRGVCLTLHQPWASLIVYGFKRIEGRVWTTDFRGRLWIHAASVEPSPEQIDQMESYYKNVYPNPNTRPSFPPNYPTRCLVGCVDLIDVATSHKGLWDKYPWIVEVNDSPFKWILKNPQRLLTPVPMPGEHKLWQLHKAPVYHRALRTSEYFKVFPAHIDNQDPLTINQEVINRIMANSDPQDVHGEAEAPWNIQKRYATIREEVLFDIELDDILVCTRKPLKITTTLIGLTNVLELKALKSFCSAIVLSIEKAFEKESSWTSSVGDPDDRVRQHIEELWSKESVYATSRIHPAIREAAETILSQGASEKKFSLGGPHIPPIDVLELYLRPSSVLNEDAPDQAGGGEAIKQADPPLIDAVVGEPLILVGISGTHVLNLGGTSEVFIGAGDVLVVHKKSSFRRLLLARTFLNDEDSPLMAQCAICILRSNILLS